MGQDPSEIREQIEETRERLSETADALADKANVRARVTQNATARKNALIGRLRRAAPSDRDQAVAQLSRTKERLVATARHAAQNPQQTREQATQAAQQAAAAARARPQLPAAAGALIVLLGLRRTGKARRATRRQGNQASLARSSE